MSTTAGTHPDIPDKSWSNPFAEGTFLHNIFGDVMKDNRDIVIMIDDHYARRGTGKTVASLQLADRMDQTEEGITNGKVTLQPEELRNAYTSHPTKSALVLDEGELGASNRQAMTKTNQALREIMSIGRVEEKYVIVNTPLRSFIDKDIQKLADVWISMTRRGLGLVHHLKWETYSSQLHTPKKQWIEFDDIERGTPLREVYNHLTREKRSHISGEGGTSFITEEEHNEIVAQVRKDTAKETRNAIIKSIYNHHEIVEECGVSQRMIGEVVDLTQQQVGNIVRGG